MDVPDRFLVTIKASAVTEKTDRLLKTLPKSFLPYCREARELLYRLGEITDPAAAEALLEKVHRLIKQARAEKRRRRRESWYTEV